MTVLSITALAKSCIDSTNATMNANAARRFHHTAGSRESSVRALLIIVPMAAIFGSAFPDVVKSVLVDRIDPVEKKIQFALLEEVPRAAKRGKRR